MKASKEEQRGVKRFFWAEEVSWIEIDFRVVDVYAGNAFWKTTVMELSKQFRKEEAPSFALSKVLPTMGSNVIEQ